MMDPAITLFGKKIQINGEEEGSPRVTDECINESFDSSEHHEAEHSISKELAEEESVETDQPDVSSAVAMEERTDPPAISETDDQKDKTTDSDKDCESQKDEQESNDVNNSQQKQLKKPDKILPCPRCNSMDTKFCYYNNYNINQPRHFCKSCQRYWTAGGTMRNVPVGAGRRKNKSSVSRYCHITVSEALQAARLDVPFGVHPGLKTNGTILTYGSDDPLCDSMSSVLNLADKKVLNGTNRNGFHLIDHIVPVSNQGMESGDDRSSCSTATTSSMEDHAKKGGQETKQHMNGFNNQMPCFQWPYMWNSAVPIPQGFYPSPFPMPIYPPPYWNVTATPCNVPWMPQCPPGQKSPESSPNSPTLGKHSRDGEIITPGDNNRSTGTTTTVLVPKTLRIDDPDDAAKSSIWTTLGIKKDKSDVSKGFFNSFISKAAEKKHRKVEPPPELKANPAALCRSITFQERA